MKSGKLCLILGIVLSALVWGGFSKAYAEENKSKEKMRLVVMDLQPKNVSKVIAVTITDMVRAEMVDVGRFHVLERSQMNMILKEQALQMTGCTDSSCAVKIGRLLSARKILIGEVNQLGTSTVITVRIVDVEQGVADFSTSEKAENISELDKATKKLVRKLTERITGQVVHYSGPTKTGYYLRGIIPGWGQIYAGNGQKGMYYMGGFAACTGVWAYTFWNYQQKRKAYSDLSPGSSDFDSKYDEYNMAGKTMIAFSAILGALYIANWVDLLFFTDAPASMAGNMLYSRQGDGYIALNMLQENHSTQGEYINREPLSLHGDMYLSISYIKKF